MLSLSFRSHCGLRVRFFHCLLLQPFREISFCPWFYTIVPFFRSSTRTVLFFYMAIYWQPFPLTTIWETTLKPPRRFITYARPHTNYFRVLIGVMHRLNQAKEKSPVNYLPTGLWFFKCFIILISKFIAYWEVMNCDLIPIPWN